MNGHTTSSASTAKAKNATSGKSSSCGASMTEQEDLAKKVVLQKLDDVNVKGVSWHWPNWTPLGKLSILDGDPDLGKSTLLLDLAARTSRDGIMPDGSQGVCGDVVILSAEDDVEDTIKPRLLAAGANMSRIDFLKEIDG